MCSSNISIKSRSVLNVTIILVYIINMRSSVKATIPDFVPIILTWMCVIFTVYVYSYKKTYNG